MSRLKRNLNLKVGENVFVTLYGGNITRRKDMSLKNIDNWCFNGEVVSVGRKYIKVKFKGMIDTFVIENDYEQKYTCGCPDYKIYLSKEEIVEERRSAELYSKVKMLFSSYTNPYGYSSEDLEKIIEILSIYKED